MSVGDLTGEHVPRLLVAHLQTWLGEWPPRASGVTVVGYEPRTQPGWDGFVHDIVGVATPNAAVLSVPPEVVSDVAALVHGQSFAAHIAALNEGLPSIMQRSGRLGQGVFRWSDAPTATPDAGEWVSTEDPRVPAWLRPFNGDVLLAWDDEGNYGAGVGRKQHDSSGHELSVGTEEALRGRGMARLLVATAARKVLDDGAIATYLHAPDNHASAKVAVAAGFPDVGWSVLGFWGT